MQDDDELFLPLPSSPSSLPLPIPPSPKQDTEGEENHEEIISAFAGRQGGGWVVGWQSLWERLRKREKPDDASE